MSMSMSIEHEPRGMEWNRQSREQRAEKREERTEMNFESWIEQIDGEGGRGKGEKKCFRGFPGHLGFHLRLGCSLRVLSCLRMYCVYILV